MSQKLVKYDVDSKRQFINRTRGRPRAVCLPDGADEAFPADNDDRPSARVFTGCCVCTISLCASKRLDFRRKRGTVHHSTDCMSPCEESRNVA